MITETWYQADVYQMMAYGRLYRCGELTLLYRYHRQSGGDEELVGDYAVNGSQDRLELFAIDVARGEDMAARLGGVCLSTTLLLAA